jgi:hypothetical protein
MLQPIANSVTRSVSEPIANSVTRSVSERDTVSLARAAGCEEDQFNRSRHIRSSAVFAEMILISIALIGCQDAKPSRYATESRIDPFDDAKCTPVEELWEAYFLGKAKVGHRHRTVDHFEYQGEQLLRIKSVDELELKRYGRTSLQILTQISIERPAGDVLSIGYELRTPDSNQRCTGFAQGGRLELIHSNGDSAHTRHIPFSNRSAGIFAVENSLAAKPMAPGESREVFAFRPLVDRVAHIRLTAKEYAETHDPNGARRLLKIEATESAAEGWPTLTTLWTDERGIIWKSSDPFLNRETFRVDKPQAMASNTFLSTDVGIETGVAIEDAFPRPADSTRATYRVRLTDMDPNLVFDTGLTQSVESMGDGSVRITVRSVSPENPQPIDSPQTPPTDTDRRPNALVDSDHPRVKAYATAIAGSPDQPSSLTNPWLIATTIEQHLHATLKKNAISQVFDSAGSVAEKESGDCSEHAVLLAAICRAAGIPARVAVGMIYSEGDHRFLFHMWNEVWIKDRWIPLDATVGNGRVAADHLKFLDSSLSGETAYSIVAPVVALAGRLTIEVENVEHGR